MYHIRWQPCRQRKAELTPGWPCLSIDAQPCMHDMRSIDMSQENKENKELCPEKWQYRCIDNGRTYSSVTNESLAVTVGTRP
jgi:hypothetical protein